uniref:Gustatory receptor n=1 Tax=Anopheles dirus TaxID=7168 RepID=A0A182N5M5_9DIPT
MLQRRQHNAFINRFRWTLRAQHVFGVSTLTIDNKGKVHSGGVAPKLILTTLGFCILLSVWLIYQNNETAFVCKNNVKGVGLFYYFVIMETIITISFNLLCTIRISWRSSQKSLAHCWEQLIGKMQEMEVMYRLSVESKRMFVFFWMWLLVLSISYGFFLTYVVLSSTILFIVQTNHYILYGMRIYSYLSDSTVSASFALFALLLRNLIREIQELLRKTNVDEKLLRSIIQLYRHILQIIECFCAIYGWVLLLIFFEHFLILTDRSFFAIRMYRMPVGFTMGNMISTLSTWILPLFLNDMLLIGACTAAEEALHALEKQLCSIGKATVANGDDDLTFMATSFSLYVANRKPKFRILKSINLNFNMLYGICGVIVTYMTVFLQFDNGSTF